MAGMSLLSSGEQYHSELTVDRISGLPWHIQNNIYQKMPIIDAIRMCVLAKDWRDKWLSLSDFCLDCHDISNFLNTKYIRWDIVSSIVNNYLLQHTGPIRVFSLKSYCSPYYPDMYQWIQYLSQQNVEVLIIQEYSRVQFVMPLHLFDFERLQSLLLTRCSLRVPSGFKGFKYIETLFLSEVEISEDDLNHLISSCPNLQQLTLLIIAGLRNLRIRAPKLAWLRIDTRFGTIDVGNAPFLVEVTIADSFRGPWEGPFLGRENLINCLRRLGSLLTLSLYGDFIKVLATDFRLEESPLTNTTLTSLFLHRVRFENVEVFRVCLSLLCSCPNIRDFRFTIESSKGSKLITDFINESRGRSLTFPELKSMTVTCLGRVGMGATVNFIEFIIAESPNLKFLTIVKEGGFDMNYTRVAQMLARFRKHCPYASIRYMHEGVADMLSP